MAELRAQLPSDIRDVPIVRDPSLQGNAVRAHYTYDARGRVTGVELRVGPTAQARHIADHVNTVRTLQGYQGLSGRVRLALDKLNAWIAGHPNVRPGSLAWETRREVEKLQAIVDARARALDGTNLTDAQRAELENERREYARQLARHEANLERITNEPGRGYVAAEASDGSTPDDLSDLRAALPSDLARIPVVRDPSLPNGTVRPGFVRDSAGRITGVEIRVGPGATAEGLEAQLEQIAAMQKYQNLPAQVRALHARANRYLIANRGAGPGTVAHETRRKLEIFSAIIAARTDALALDSLDPAHRAEVEQFLATYERGLGLNAITTDTAALVLHLEAYAEFLNTYAETLDAIEENPALAAAPASDLSVNQTLITDRDRSVFDTNPRPSELVLDRRRGPSGSLGITRAVVNRANRAARNQGLPNNSDHGIFVRAPNGTFVRYLPLNLGRPQGVVALVDAAYLARETNAAQGRGDKDGMGRKATGKDIVGRRPEHDRGHLLANILGGGDIPQNLFPLESGINQNEMSQAEVALRNDISNRPGRFWIRTDVIYDEVTGEPRSLVVRVTDATVDEQGRVQPPADRDATETAYWYPNYFVDPNAGQPASASHPTGPTGQGPSANNPPGPSVPSSPSGNAQSSTPAPGTNTPPSGPPGGAVTPQSPHPPTSPNPAPITQGDDDDNTVLDLFGGLHSQVPGAINVDVNAQSGRQADARDLPFEDESVDELIATNPYIPDLPSGSNAANTWLPEAARVLRTGGRLTVTGRLDLNKYAKLPSAETLEALGFRLVQGPGPVTDPRIVGQTMVTGSGRVIPVHTLQSYTLERLPR